jgi:serine-type D-Ala-D-Ala carboxypeptidase/endopeptidase (penicillin-binding protein 4)
MADLGKFVSAGLPTGRGRHRPWASVFSLLSAVIFAHSLTAQQPLQSKPSVPMVGASSARADVARFRARVESILADSRAERASWGILVADRDTGRQLYSLNADHFFTPASNAKIFTTALALATLGPDYRFHTTIESNGLLDNDGRLAGDLVLVGRGDPDLSNRKFPYDKKDETEGPIDKVLAEMADAAVAKGLKEVDGDIVADDSYFPYDPYPEGWSVGDLFFKFGAPVSAIAFNDNAVSVEMRPGTTLGEPPAITVQPEAAASSLGLELTTVSSSEKSEFAVVRQPEANFLLLRGSIALGHAPMRIDVAMPDPAATAAAELKRLLEARGVAVKGGVRAQHGAPPRTSPSGEPVFNQPIDPPTNRDRSLILAEHVSQPLLEIIRVTNKVSQNLHAEVLLRTAGREKLGSGSTAAGLKVERNFLKEAGIADGDVILSDGCGLARDDLVTPRAIAALLSYALRQPWGEGFLSTLPVAGVDGTLENRMKNTAAAGLVEAKTGSADHARALSGYATTHRGEYLVFSLFDNNNPQHGTDATAALDAITTAMVETLGAGADARKGK